jgi:hypothetical protein
MSLEAMSATTPPPPQSSVPPAPLPLEYEPPRAAQPPGGRAQLALGIFASLFFATGIGMALFGMLMAAGFRDDNAGPIAVGVAFLVLGAGFVALMVWLRRPVR